MSARIPFFLINSGNTLLTTADKIDIYKMSAPTVVVASTDPSGSELQIHDNHDGVYYVESSNADFPTDKYLAKVNSISQKELYNVILINDDLVEHLKNSMKHREIDDSAGDGATTKLYSANKIFDELALKATEEDLILLETVVEGKAASNHEHNAADVDIVDTESLITATEVEAALQEIFGKVGNIDWNSVAIKRGISEDDNITEAINALAAEIDIIDGTIKAVTGGEKKVIVDTEYIEKSVVVESGTTSIMIACADLTKFRMLDYKCMAKAADAGIISLYVDDSLKGSVAIKETDYTNYTGSYNISALTGSHKIELKLVDIVGIQSPAIYSKLHSIEMAV